MAASNPHRLVVVGGGNMGAALATGLVRRGWTPEELAVIEVLAARRAQLAEQLPGVDVRADLPPTAAAVLAVKPNDAPAAATAVAQAGARRVLSIAAGVTIASLEASCGAGVAVVRAMPNTPALVGQGVAAVAGGREAAADDLVWAESILGAVGTVVRVPEHQLDAVTGLAGSGPAYLFLVAEALIDAGVLAGLGRETSLALVRQLLVGSAALLDRDGADPSALRAMVTSPGGTTAAGLRVLEEHAVRSAFLEAVTAATARSRELGGPDGT